VVVGIVFVMHGGQKWFAWGPHDTAANFTRMHVPLPMISALLTMAAELLCGLALIVGLFTRIATIPLMIVMTVALLFVHIRNGFFLPVGCEYVLVLLVALIAIRTLGPGEASMDNSVGGRRR
jgi:putative oxidoreductase